MSRVLLKSALGTDDPTKAAFAFLHAEAFAQAGHEVQIFLLGEAVGLMRTCVSDGKNATFATPATLVSLVEWADKILSE